MTISGRISLSPEQNPLRSRVATRLVERWVVGRLGRDRTLLARIEFRSFEAEWLDALAVEDVFDRGLDRFERAAKDRPVIRSSESRARTLGLDHLADVVVKLDQVDEDRPLNLQEKVLLVVLKLGVKPVDHPLARGLGAELALKGRLEQVEPSAQLIGQPFNGFEQPRRLTSPMQVRPAARRQTACSAEPRTGARSRPRTVALPPAVR